MADLTTLGRIVEALQAQAGRGSVAPLPFDRAGAAPVAAPRFIGRFALTTLSAPAPGLVSASLTELGTWQVVDGGAGLADAVVAALVASGIDARVSDPELPGRRPRGPLPGRPAPRRRPRQQRRPAPRWPARRAVPGGECV